MLGFILRFDNLIYNFINQNLYNPLAFWFFAALTNLADIILLGFLFYFIYLVLLGRGKSGERKVVLLVLLSAIIAEAITLAGKILIHRGLPTPYVKVFPEFLVLPIKYGLYAFPSGHTSRVFAMATVLGQQYRRWWILLFVFAALIGFSRVYIGAHYPLDVVAGAVLGIGVSLVVLQIFRLERETLSEKSSGS